MKVLFVLLSLIPITQSTGFLSFKLTSDNDCLLHLNHSLEYYKTIRLLAYETTVIEVPTFSNSNQQTISFQFLHHFSGKPLTDHFPLKFQLTNNGKMESRVVDSLVILSIQYVFECDSGYYGPNCERRSRIMTTTARMTVVEASRRKVDFGNGITDEMIIYSTLIFFILLLIIANCIICFYRPQNPRKYLEDTLPFEIPLNFRINRPLELKSIPSKSTSTLCSRV